MPNASESRALLHSREFGILATVSNRMPGYPFASVVPYALDGAGHPIFLLSRLAVHTQNLLQDARASLLVFAPETESDPLNSARLNLFGDIAAVPPAELDTTRALYLNRNPKAEQWIDFGDFALYRMTISDAYYVGGFGVMGWVAGSAFGNT